MSGRLLSIDVDAELSKLSLGRLRNSHQAPVALARCAAAAGARSVSAWLSRSQIRLDHDGQVPSRQAVDDLTILFDRTLTDDATRHAALERLEAAGLLDLLVAFAVGGRVVDMDIGPPVSLRFRVWNRRGRLELEGVFPSGREQGVGIQIQGKRRNTGADIRELTDALRFASIPVRVNGNRVDRGLHPEDALLEVPFQKDGYRGSVGLPRRGFAATTRMLVHGVVDRETWASPEDGMVWEAVVECPPAVSTRRVVKLVHRQAPALYALARRSYTALDHQDAGRVKQLLFRLADAGAGADAVAGVALFNTVDGSRVSSEGLKELALGRTVRAVGPGVDPDRFDLSGKVFVLDEQDRGFIERHLKLLVREPPRRPIRRLGSLKRLANWVRSAFRKAVRSLTARREVPRQRLHPGELAFLTSVNRVLQAGWFQNGRVRVAAFARGRRGGWRRTAPGGRSARLLFSRHHPRVQEMIAAFELDPRTLYASLMLLADGNEPFGDHRGEVEDFVLGLTT